MSNVKDSKAPKQTEEPASPSSPPARCLSSADPALEQENKLDDLLNPEPALCPVRNRHPQRQRRQQTDSEMRRHRRSLCTFPTETHQKRCPEPKTEWPFPAGALPLLLLRPHPRCCKHCSDTGSAKHKAQGRQSERRDAPGREHPKSQPPLGHGGTPTAMSGGVAAAVA